MNLDLFWPSKLFVYKMCNLDGDQNENSDDLGTIRDQIEENSINHDSECYSKISHESHNWRLSFLVDIEHGHLGYDVCYSGAGKHDSRFLAPNHF